MLQFLQIVIFLLVLSISQIHSQDTDNVGKVVGITQNDTSENYSPLAGGNAANDAEAAIFQESYQLVKWFYCGLSEVINKGFEVDAKNVSFLISQSLENFLLKVLIQTSEENFSGLELSIDQITNSVQIQIENMYKNETNFSNVDVKTKIQDSYRIVQSNIYSYLFLSDEKEFKTENLKDDNKKAPSFQIKNQNFFDIDFTIFDDVFIKQIIVQQFNGFFGDFFDNSIFLNFQLNLSNYHFDFTHDFGGKYGGSHAPENVPDFDQIFDLFYDKKALNNKKIYSKSNPPISEFEFDDIYDLQTKLQYLFLHALQNFESDQSDSNLKIIGSELIQSLSSVINQFISQDGKNIKKKSMEISSIIEYALIQATMSDVKSDYQNKSVSGEKMKELLSKVILQIEVFDFTTNLISIVLHTVSENIQKIIQAEISKLKYEDSKNKKFNHMDGYCYDIYDGKNHQQSYLVMDECYDVTPPGHYSCKEQKEFGKCEHGWMIEGNYCQKTCGKCPQQYTEQDAASHCSDVAPPGHWTCQQQKEFGKCGCYWMKQGSYCQKTCDACPQKNTCTDIPPDNIYSCSEQKAFGKCFAHWMMEHGYCKATCGQCHKDKY